MHIKLGQSSVSMTIKSKTSLSVRTIHLISINGIKNMYLNRDYRGNENQSDDKTETIDSNLFKSSKYICEM